jgi:hypothetical protein
MGMNYAIVENGLVTNIIWLYEGNADEFSSAIPLGDRPVGIGDTYVDGVFSRDGVTVLTPLETAQATIGELDDAVVDYAYQNALLTLGVTEEGDGL